MEEWKWKRAVGRGREGRECSTLLHTPHAAWSVCDYQERDVLERIKRQLQAKISEAFEHLCVLQDLRQTMLTDLQNKNITLDIDVDQYNLNCDSNGTSFKPDPTRRPKQSVSVSVSVCFARRTGAPSGEFLH